MNNNKFNQGENMREYLFRGFCKKENRWEYGFLEWERESDEKDKPEIIGNIHDNPELLDDPPSAKI